MRKALVVIAFVAMGGCAGTPISNFTHADLQNAEKIAATPERAAVWKAVDARLTSLEQVNAAIAAQAKACAASVKQSMPAGPVGAATLIEEAHNAKAAIDANCVPIPISIP